jgi:glycosyltransferase involved in cell wall biosynthesis
MIAPGHASAQRINPHGADHVVILLALFEGADRFDDQLGSLLCQTHRDWSLIVSDDGSTDAGPDILLRFAQANPDRAISLIDGPRMGFARNFLHLLRAACPNAPFVSFCDQDDVWLAHKTERAVTTLRAIDAATPAMYCGRTLHCDENLQPLRSSPLFPKRPSFRNALVQNIGGGNTIVLNNAALRMLAKASTRVDGIVSHDWWAYQMITGAGGTVLYEREPGLLYRQHGNNAVGANGTARTAMRRFIRVMQGRFRDWNDENIEALQANADLLTPENREILKAFAAARQAPIRRRLRAMARLGLHRQSARDNLALWFAIVTGRV